MKTKLFKLLLLVLTLSVLAACGSDGNDGSTGKDGQDGEDAWALPKHVILFIGDGMHEEHEAAASRYYYGDETSLVWKDSSVFPYSNYATTWDVTAYNTLASERSEASYAADTFSGRTGFDVLQMGLSSITKDKYFLDSSMGAAATDSASAGTAIATGVKTDAGNIAWESGDPANGEIQTIAEYYKAKTTPGKIGVVTTVPISHATPAAFVSHNVYRNNNHAIFTEISTVTKPDVVIGGGHPQVYNETYLTNAQLTTVQGDASYEYVARNTGTDGATALATATANAVTNGTGLFGVFGSAGGQIATPTVTDTPGTPSFTKTENESPVLAESTEAALTVLSSGGGAGGFFVMLEQGDIDWTNHSNDYRGMVGGVLDLHYAVEKAEEMIDNGVNGMSWANTTIIVTSDHGNSYLRFNRGKTNGLGDLPLQEVKTVSNCPAGNYCGSYVYPDGEVFYGTGGHTNELVSVYAKGADISKLTARQGVLYPGTALIDNTDLFRVMKSIADANRNVILFIGDGMQKAHEIAASRYMFGIDNPEALSFHSFDFKANCTTWDVDTYNSYAKAKGKDLYAVAKMNNRIEYGTVGYDVAVAGSYSYPQLEDEYIRRYAATDSASAGTALATGNKTVDGNIAWLPGDLAGGNLKTIAEKVKSQRKGAIGVVTTVPFSHATPAAFVSHNVSRNNYGEIAAEIITTTRPDVVIGAGHPSYVGTPSAPNYQYITQASYNAIKADTGYIFVERTNGVTGGTALLNAADSAVTAKKKLFGLFGGTGGQVATPTVTDTPGAPTFAATDSESPLLADSTEAALRVLAQNNNGFFLMVEQGDIDWTNHANDYKGMVGGVIDLEYAVKKAMEFVDQPGDNIDWSNTLLIVTSDHGNSFLRLNNTLKPGLGDLPAQQSYVAPCPGTWCGSNIYPDGEVFYGTGGHTNELVSVYAKGDFAGETFSKYNGKMYDEGVTKIIDNTFIFKAMANFLGVTVSQ